MAQRSLHHVQTGAAGAGGAAAVGHPAAGWSPRTTGRDPGPAVSAALKPPAGADCD